MQVTELLLRTFMRATKPAREKVSIIYRTLDNQRSLETETIGRLETTGDDVPVQALLQLQQRTEACGQPGGLDISQEEVRTAVTRVYTATIAALKEADERQPEKEIVYSSPLPRPINANRPQAGRQFCPAKLTPCGRN
jgi:hypothetical protein